MCAGDMRGQVEAAMNNVETVLACPGFVPRSRGPVEFLLQQMLTVCLPTTT